MSQLNINIKAKNLELTQDLKNHINEKISQIEKFMNLTPEESVIVDVEVKKKHGEHHHKGEIFHTEINLELSGKFFRAESVKEDIKIAIDDAQSDMVRQIRKNKERRGDLFKRGAKRIKNFLKFRN